MLQCICTFGVHACAPVYMHTHRCICTLSRIFVPSVYVPVYTHFKLFFISMGAYENNNLFI